MQTEIRPRRSALYMPGSNTRALDKGRSLAADVLILDLEDSVTFDRKAEARTNVLAALAQGGYGHRELLVRVNGLETPWGRDDLEAIAESGADGVVLTKVESADYVRKVIHILKEAGAADGVGVWAMIETPFGVMGVEDIAAALPQSGGLMMGTADLAKNLNCRLGPERTAALYTLSRSIVAARAHGLSILDGVFEDLEDDDGFIHSCRQGVELGFDGKTLIHPKTIDAANAAFGPDPDDVDEARSMVDAFEKARLAGDAVITVNGKLVERLHVERARRLIALAERINSEEH